MAKDVEMKVCKIMEYEKDKEGNEIYTVVGIEFCHDEEDYYHILTGDFVGEIIPAIGTPEVKQFGFAGLSYDQTFLLDVFHTCNLEQARSEFEKMYVGRKYLLSDNKIHILEEINEKDDEKPKFCFDKNIDEIIDKVKKSVISQDEAVKKIATTIYTNQNVFNSDILSKEEKFQSKNNILIVGESGCGKTEIIRQITSILNVPYIIVTANDYTVSGYVGKDVDSIIMDLMDKTDDDEERAKKAIVIVDEIDKIGSYDKDIGSIATDGVQKALLKMVEGAEISVVSDKMTQENFFFDTSNLTFVFLGAFSEIFEKREKPKRMLGFEQSSNDKKIVKQENITREELIKYGFIKEFLGRIPVIVQLNSLNEDDYKKIMIDSDLSLLKLKTKYYNAMGVDLTYDDEFINDIARKVVNEKCGARGIKAVLSNIFEELDYEILQGNLKEIKLEKDKVIRVRK